MGDFCVIITLTNLLSSEGSNMKYRYDLHVHTKESSACASSTAAEMVDMYKSEGYTGIVITDHFFNGNTSVNRQLEWNEWITTYCQSYKNAKQRGDEIGLDVFFGFEYSYAGTDFIVLGLDEEWLLAHPEVKNIKVAEFLKLAHEHGGFIIHAHPYLIASWAPVIRLMPDHEDAVEVINAPKGDFINARAEEYAKGYDKIRTGGSDAHWTGVDKLSGIETDYKAESVQDLIVILKKREHEVFLYERVIKE